MWRRRRTLPDVQFERARREAADAGGFKTEVDKDGWRH
jgi:hypothetical protein